MKQKPGWDREMLQWCLLEARERNLKDQDYWRGFVIDEMKIQVFKCQSQFCCQFLVLNGKVSFVNQLFTYYIGGPTNGSQRWQTPVGWIC